MRVGAFKWAVAVGLTAAGLKAYVSRGELSAWLQQHRFQTPGLERALPCEMYLLATNRWLEFELLKDAPQARLISNASILADVAAVPGAEWPYAVEYELSGGLLPPRRGVYHFKAGPLPYVERFTGQPVEVNFFLDRKLRPLGGLQWFINLEDPEYVSARRLRLRLHARHPDVVDVGIRVYSRTRVPERKTAYLWNRLSEDQKRDLARGNVYGFEGLTAAEKECLLRYHWAVAAPEGVPRRDYERRTLFVREDAESLKAVQQWTPAGLCVEPGHAAVLPFTNAPGWSLVRLFDSGPTSTVALVTSTILRHGDAEPDVRTNVITWCGQEHAFPVTNENALLEIHSSRPAYLRTYHVQGAVTNETTPAPPRLLTFTCAPADALRFEVGHAGVDPTPFRLDVRRLPRPDGNFPDGDTGSLALLNRVGDPVRECTLVLTNTVSRFDWHVTTNGLAAVSAPQSFFFLLPADVAAVRLASASGCVLANAYTRPLSLPKELRVPEDYLAAQAFAPKQPTWFAVRPPDHLERRFAGLAAYVQIQLAPSEPDPRILEGQYEWDAFPAEGEVRGHLVLLPLDPSRPLRQDNLGYSYFPLPLGSARGIRLTGGPWQPQVSPTLLLVATNSSNPAATVTVDGQTVFRQRLNLPVTQLRLGSLSPGDHGIAVQGEAGTAAYLNYLQQPQGAGYLQRFCVMAHSNLLSFAYEKQAAGPELLALGLLAPRSTGPPQPYRVCMTLQAGENRGIGPFAELTILERQATVTPATGGQSWLVSAQPAALHDSQTLFFPVGSDVPPGRYKVEVRVTADSPRWLSLSRTTPGLGEKLSILAQRR